MRTGYRKVLRDLWRSKGRTLLAVLSIFIGVFAVGTISGMNDLMPARMVASYGATNPAHIVIYLNGGVTDDDITSLSHVPGVLGVEGDNSLGEQWRLTPDMPWRNGSFVMRKYEQQKFNTIELLSGAWPTKDTVAVDITAVESLGLPAQGVVTVKINDRERELRIAGVVRDLAINSPAFGGNAMFYINQDMADTVFGWGRYGHLRVQLPAFSQQEAEVSWPGSAPRLEKIGAPVFFYQIQPPNKHPAQDILNGIMTILSVMAILSLGLGLFLVINTVNAIVAQQVPQIGVIKAIGGSTRQLMVLYLSGVLAYGLIALLLAVPLAALASNAATEAMLKLLAVPADPAFRFSNQAVTQQAIIALLVPLLAALWPIFSGVRITVRQAISATGSGRLWQRPARSAAQPFTFPASHGQPDHSQYVPPQRACAAHRDDADLAGVVFIMVMSSAASFTYTINWLTDVLGLRVLINFQRPLRIDEVMTVIDAQPNVDKVEMQLLQSSSAFRDEDAEKGEDVRQCGAAGINLA
jgi:putative ABC transport system permease protein